MLNIYLEDVKFWLDPESSYYKANKIKDLKKMVHFSIGIKVCFSYKSLIDMGFKK